ncbi:beta-ketoacyl-ACP reductase [Desulfosarcina ovata subsp. sediminis]|uniref:Beta-ketoacyl-ACP reductase n=1 Tax=Desulfosarcina ovata subsp. sediminis TaxID=885957 RepID=A0A5K7ZBX2_9BACT|nr:SDR family oxidoreductase [Desulfosarcina ovata]BBO79462.1 beta-ketoacyl-ACP reductase [Desulfosarcina ovata subsp. sediminis]
MGGIKDKVAVVSGVTDEIGEAISLRFADEGAKVVVCDIDQQRVDNIVEKIKGKNQQAMGFVVNFSNPENVKKTIDEITDKLGAIDVLVNNLDESQGWEIADVTDERWEKSLAANMNAVFYFCREIVPGMQKNQYGRVINISGIDYLGGPGKSNCSATKAAVFGLTRSLALESAKDNVTINCVIKGDIAGSDISDEQSEKMAARIPVKKVGKPEDVAMAVNFFASESAKYVTGQMLFVCGGKSLYSSMSV